MFKSTLIAVLLGFTGNPAWADTLSFSDPWIRATPPGAISAAAYVTIENMGEGDRLVGAHSEAAREVGVHATVDEGGLVKMTGLDALSVPAGQVTKLEPGRSHIMLIDIEHPLVSGETVEVTLLFERAGPREITFAVRDARAPKP